MVGTSFNIDVKVKGVNDAPVDVDADAYSLTPSASSVVLLASQLAADIDNGAKLTFTDFVASSSSGITYQISTDGTQITLTAIAKTLAQLGQGETLTAHHGFTIVDEHGASVNRSVQIQLVGVNDAPVAKSLGNLGTFDESAYVKILLQYRNRRRYQ